MKNTKKYSEDEFNEAPPLPTQVTDKIIILGTPDYQECLNAINEKQVNMNDKQTSINDTLKNRKNELKNKKNDLKNIKKGQNRSEITKKINILKNKLEITLIQNSRLKTRNNALNALREALLGGKVINVTTTSYPTEEEAKRNLDNCKAKCRNEIRPKFVQAGYKQPGGPCDTDCDNYLVGGIDIQTFLNEVNEI